MILAANFISNIVNKKKPVDFARCKNNSLSLLNANAIQNLNNMTHSMFWRSQVSTE